MKSMRQNGKERRRWRSLRRQVRREAARLQRFTEQRHLILAGAAEQLDEAERYATEAHKVHTELLVREAGGQQTDGGLLVAHAQDHFMMATLAQELAEEIVDVYRALGETKGGSQ